LKATKGELLDKAIKAYTNKSIEAAEIVQWLIELAKKMGRNNKKAANLTSQKKKSHSTTL
jgi:hypothetical protein